MQHQSALQSGECNSQAPSPRSIALDETSLRLLSNTKVSRDKTQQRRKNKAKEQEKRQSRRSAEKRKNQVVPIPMQKRPRHFFTKSLCPAPMYVWENGKKTLPKTSVVSMKMEGSSITQKCHWTARQGRGPQSVQNPVSSHSNTKVS